MDMNIRPTQSADLPALKVVLDETGLFPSDMLSDMIGGFLSKEESEDLWLTVEVGQKAVGFCYAVPEKLTDGTWNMLAIAVLPSQQGSGLGGAITQKLEDMLRERGSRILIADTSGTEQFARTRKFYTKFGYSEEARIRDFWATGDDKVTFRKALLTLP
jgi:ribosomal protein S18 acetylase RimI-like enzyme